MEEFEILTDEEKAVAVRSKIKNIQYNKYNIELDLLTENSINNPNASQIIEWNRQLEDLNAKETVLQNELDEVLGNV